jgi:hypothetical protein
MRKLPSILAVGLGAALVVGGPSVTADITSAPTARAVVTVYASGLNNPRGLKFGPDGNLYVAEGGIGGKNPPPDDPACVVDPPVGPYLGRQGGSRISMIDGDGVRTTVVDHLPSSQTSADLGSLVSGVADVAFVGKTLYAVLAGAGCSHGVRGIPNGVIRVKDGQWTMIANLSRFQRRNPVANPEPADFEPDGTWYSLIANAGELYAVEPNHGEVVKVSMDGAIRRVIDISASKGHVVPTAIAFNRGKFYVGNLYLFPQDKGVARVWTLTPEGHIAFHTGGFNMVTGLAFDDRNRMYVLEASAPPAPAPGTGRIVRVDPDGHGRVVIADGLFLPTAMTMGPDGNLYVSNVGFGPPPVGLGEVLKIELPD